MLSCWVALVATKHQYLVEKAIIYRGKIHHAIFMFWGAQTVQIIKILKIMKYQLLLLHSPVEGQSTMNIVCIFAFYKTKQPRPPNKCSRTMGTTIVQALDDK